jgi:betaine-aldehyde dehydrogenase
MPLPAAPPPGQPVPTPIPCKGLYINGRFVPPAAGGALDAVDPATEQVIARIPAATKPDVDAAIAAAAEAHAEGVWGGRGPEPGASAAAAQKRAAVLRRLAELLREHKLYLARLETMDMGKPIDEAEWDLDDVAGCFDYYAGLAEERFCGGGGGGGGGGGAAAAASIPPQLPPLIDVGMDEFRVRVHREPLGVVGLVTPWNYPLLLAAGWKVAPALAAGCCVVLKPSEVASLTCLAFAELAHAAGVPPGVLNVVTGTGSDAGAPLVSHPGLAKVAFTGSTQTGRRVALAAAQNLRPATMELGGKSALIIFDDADLDKACEWAMFGCFWTNGQICSATSRLLVHETVAEAFLEKLKRRAEAIPMGGGSGSPLAPGCRLGPVASREQHAKVLGYIESARAEGARVLTGGGRPSGAPADGKGFFVAPTVLVGVTPSMRVWREEIFGPVLCAATFSTEQQAVGAANASNFGLGGAVISRDPQRCARVAKQLEAGIVWVNCSQPCFFQAPWGGVKDSGHGRELGPWGFDNYLSVKQVTEYVSDKPWGWYLDAAAEGTEGAGAEGEAGGEAPRPPSPSKL